MILFALGETQELSPQFEQQSLLGIMAYHHVQNQQKRLHLAGRNGRKQHFLETFDPILGCVTFLHPWNATLLQNV